MRILMFLAVFTVFFPVIGYAQDHGNSHGHGEERVVEPRGPSPKYYVNPNFTQYSGGVSSLYVAPAATAAYNPSSPIMLKQMLQGKGQTGNTAAAAMTYYGGANARPHGARGNYSLNLSPQQIKANRVSRERKASEDARRQKLEQQREARRNPIPKPTNLYDTPYQQQGTRARQQQQVSVRPKPRVVYKKPSLGGTSNRVFGNN